jgi:tetratricopeptide (TPR) repeat protein
MNFPDLKSITRRPPVILTSLLVLAVLTFAGVNRLVNRFREQEKALARHLYESGLKAQSAGNPEAALGDFRAALSYSHDDFQYQLSLARALRDTGRTAEAETYLISLWERNPQEGLVNLALGRLFARERLFEKTIQYYHNAIYGFWPNDSEARRRDAQFELIEFLLKQKAYPQAQAELINLASAIPGDPSLHLRVAEQFTQAQDDEQALAQYQQILESDPSNQAALFGAGQVAFNLGRYRTAEGYLHTVVPADVKNAKARALLDTTSLVLRSDPFGPRISDAERNRRVHSAFFLAGDRLDSCSKSQGIDLSQESLPHGLPSLKSEWLEIKPELAKVKPSDDGVLDRVMDLVFEIERQTRGVCGQPEGSDQALLLISQDHARVER